MKIAKYLVFQAYMVGTLFMLTLMNPPVFTDEQKQLLENCGPVKSDIVGSILGGRHETIDAIFWFAIAGLVLSISLESEIPLRTRIIAAFFWIFLILVANPITR